MPDKERLYDVSFQYDFVGKDKVQSDVSTKIIGINPKDETTAKFNVFVGPKKFELLDSYAKKYNFTLFDRAIDFGWLYVITKPMFLMLLFISRYVSNFGFAILILTFIIKVLMLGINSKSYKSMKKMKDIQPQVDQLKEKYKDDKMRFNKEVLELYKQNKVNPFSGLLSMLLQFPIFFSIYKVLYVTIEMRHAEFIGWIHDLSSPDPTNIFNLFGLLPYENLPATLHVGVWPILMSISMYVQQLFSPIQDPVQAKIIRLLPLIFLFTFSGFPAGLLIYWTFSNLISIGQQLLLKSKNKYKGTTHLKIT